MDDEDVFLDEEMGEIEITTKPKEDISDLAMLNISLRALPESVPKP